MLILKREYREKERETGKNDERCQVKEVFKCLTLVFVEFQVVPVLTSSFFFLFFFFEGQYILKKINALDDTFL